MRDQPTERLCQNDANNGALRQSLRWPQLVDIGIRAMVGLGSGIAGPRLVLTFALADFACMLVVLTSAEMATVVPEAGGAYAYARSGLGALPGWIVGWSLILEYSIALAAIAVGWSAYVVHALAAIGFVLPTVASAGPAYGGTFNVPATLILIVMALMLSRGARVSARRRRRWSC